MRPTLYLCGDSLTEYGFQQDGWILQIIPGSGYFDIKNYGYAGYNTRWFCAEHLPIGVENPTIDTAVIWFGGNDCVLPDNLIRYSYQAVPVDEYANNLRIIVQHFLSQGVPPESVLIITPTPLDGVKYAQRKGNEPIRRTLEHTKKYADAALAVAKECGILSLDLFTYMSGFSDWSDRFTTEGVHFNDQGQTLVANKIKEVLPRRKIEEHFLKWKVQF